MNDLINRFVTAVENIGSALTIMANNQTLAKTPDAEKPARARKAKTEQATAVEQAAPAVTPAVEQAAPPPAAEQAAPPIQTVEQASAPAFEYETLKKAIVDLASNGAEGKEAALRILTDAGLERGQKAADAPATKWPGMYEQALAALAKIKDTDGFV